MKGNGYGLTGDGIGFRIMIGAGAHSTMAGGGILIITVGFGHLDIDGDAIGFHGIVMVPIGDGIL